MNFKVIKNWLYYERIIYLTQIDDKFQMFYRSSGENDPNSVGSIIPCYLLKVVDGEWMGDEFGDMPYGWIPKVYKVNYGFRPYWNKEENTFPDEMKQYMNAIRDYDGKGTFLVELENEPKVINEFCRGYIESEDDWKEW